VQREEERKEEMKEMAERGHNISNGWMELCSILDRI
jgi:hypothetical protein